MDKPAEKDIKIYRVWSCLLGSILVTSRTSLPDFEDLQYEVLAAENPMIGAGSYTSKGWTEAIQVPIMDLPLYLHWPNRSKKFDRLLKGCAHG